MQEYLKKYEEAGQKWLKGGVEIDGFNDIKLSEKQIKFVNSKKRYSLAYGGMGSGKTFAFVIKLYILSMFFPKNLILLGRRTRSAVEQVTLRDVFDIFPPNTYVHHPGPGTIEFPNGSEILFFGLDALQNGSGDDIKKAEQKMKSLNLGAIFIDQLEEIELKVFEALSGRLRRNIPFQQMVLTTNPANYWAYDYFMEHPRPNTEAVHFSMYDNSSHLSKEFVADQETKGEMWRRKYVLGEWSPEVLSEGTVFAEEWIKRIVPSSPLRVQDGIEIYKEPVNHVYQIGVDPSEGATDPSAIVVTDVETGDVVAVYNAFVPVQAQVERIVALASLYGRVSRPLVIPESTGVGAALIENLKRVYPKIYERQVFLERENRESNKLGFSTNYATKSQLIENMKTLFQRDFVNIKSEKIKRELQHFVYSDEVRFRGAGAENNFHDDLVMAMMLSFVNVKWNPGMKKSAAAMLLERRQERKSVVPYNYI